MIKTIVAILIITIGAMAGYSQSAADVWKPFESKRFGFKASFPGDPVVKATDLNTQNGVRTANWFSVENLGIKFEVSVTEYQPMPKMDRESLKKHYDNSRDSLLKAIGYKLLEDADIKAGKYFGRELVFEVGNEIVLDRLFLVDQRLYQLVLTIWTKDFVNGKRPAAVNNFLKSFQIIE